MTAEEEAEFLHRKNIAAQERELDKEKQTRTERNNRLKDTDWRVIVSVERGEPLEPEWITYRQALRDITTHVNFPWLDDADWPVKPE